MTQGIARDGRQDRYASFWELHFNDPDVGAFLSEAVSEFVDDIGGPGRGISWAVTLVGSAEALTLTAGSAPARAADEAQRSTLPWSGAGPDTPAPPQPSGSGPSYPFHWHHKRSSMPP
jgi:hypothetical protein